MSAAFVDCRPRRLAGSLRRQLRRLSRSTTGRSVRIRPARPTTARRRSTAASRTGCIATSGGGRFRDVTATALLGLVGSSGAGRVDRRLRQRRLGRHLRRQRRRAQLAVDEPARRHASRDAALPAGVALTGEGRAEGEHGRRCRRLRQRRRRRPDRHRAAPARAPTCTSTTAPAAFVIVSAASGLGGASLPCTGWGTAWIDFDNDGWLDLLAVNGTIIAQERSRRPAAVSLRISGSCCSAISATAGFEDVTGPGRPALRAVGVGPRRRVRRRRQRRRHRRAGRQRQRAGATCWSTSVGSRRHWLGLRLVGRRWPRHARRTRSGDARRPADAVAPGAQRRQLRLGQRSARAGRPRRVERAAPAVKVRWPDGQEESWPSVPADTWTTLTQGTGR